MTQRWQRMHDGLKLTLRIALFRSAVLLAAAAPFAHHAAAQATTATPIVFGQSLPLSGAGFPIANRVLAGARAMVERVNAAGGLQGRRLELVTLDDGGDPQRTADNVRQLARQYSALAVLNCLGERACTSAAEASRGLTMPLVGPFSGAAALHSPALRHVYTLRPDDRREAQALLGQLQAMGITRAVLLADGHEPLREQVLAEVLRAGGLTLQRLHAEATPAGIEKALRVAAGAATQALVLNLGPDGLDAMGRAGPAALADLPGTVAALSSAGLTQLTRLLRGHTLGFTSTVPIPEISQLPLVREFERDAETYAGPEALSFEGLAAYMHVRLCVDALRRTTARPEPGALARAIEGLGDSGMGGFVLRFGPGQRHGSDFVEIGMRTRDGRLRR